MLFVQMQLRHLVLLASFLLVRVLLARALLVRVLLARALLVRVLLVRVLLQEVTDLQPAELYVDKQGVKSLFIFL